MGRHALVSRVHITASSAAGFSREGTLRVGNPYLDKFFRSIEWKIVCHRHSLDTLAGRISGGAA